MKGMIFQLGPVVLDHDIGARVDRGRGTWQDVNAIVDASEMKAFAYFVYLTRIYFCYINCLATVEDKGLADYVDKKCEKLECIIQAGQAYIDHTVTCIL